jgi:integrase
MGRRIHEVQRLMGHRHITTTELYLHYAPDADAADRLSALWATATANTPQPAAAAAHNVVPLHRAA